MEIISGGGLRANSAVSASTSCCSVSISKTLSRYSIPGNRLTLSSSPSSSQGPHLPKVVAGVQGLSKINGTKVDGPKINGSTIEMASEVLKGEKQAVDCETNPAFKALLMAIATVALAAEKQRRHEELAGKIEVPVDALRQGRLVESGRVYRQTFVIRSYEVGVNKTASIETLMNHFQVNRQRIADLDSIPLLFAAFIGSFHKIGIAFQRHPRHPRATLFKSMTQHTSYFGRLKWVCIW